MSRIYITASLQHTDFGIARPTLSIDTTDHIGGGFSVGGLHPASIAAMAGKLGEIKRGERFDLKFNVNAKRSSIALVVATNKHLPHLEWSSENGMGKLPMSIGTLASTLLLGGKRLSKSEGKERQSTRISSGDEHKRRRKSHSSKPSRNHHSSSQDGNQHKSRHSSSHGSHSHKSRSHASSSVDPDRGRSRRSSTHDSQSSRSKSHVSSAQEQDRSNSRHASPRNSYSTESRASEAHDPYVRRSHRSSRSRRNHEYLYEEDEDDDEDEEDDSGYGSSDRYKKSQSRTSRDSHKKHERARYR